MADTAKQWEAKGSYVFEGGDCIAICDTDNASTATYARRAKIMAAAPDLLEALKYARRFLRGIDHDVDYVDAAIAKAEDK